MRLLSMKQVVEKTSLSRASIYRKMAEGKFPPCIALGERKRNKLGQLTGRIAFVEDLIESWLAALLK